MRLARSKMSQVIDVGTSPTHRNRMDEPPSISGQLRQAPVDVLLAIRSGQPRSLVVRMPVERHVWNRTGDPICEEDAGAGTFI